MEITLTGTITPPTPTPPPPQPYPTQLEHYSNNGSYARSALKGPLSLEPLVVAVVFRMYVKIVVANIQHMRKHMRLVQITRRNLFETF